MGLDIRISVFAVLLAGALLLSSLFSELATSAPGGVAPPRQATHAAP